MRYFSAPGKKKIPVQTTGIKGTGVSTNNLAGGNFFKNLIKGVRTIFGLGKRRSKKGRKKRSRRIATKKDVWWVKSHRRKAHYRGV